MSRLYLRSRYTNLVQRPCDNSNTEWLKSCCLELEAACRLIPLKEPSHAIER